MNSIYTNKSKHAEPSIADHNLQPSKKLQAWIEQAKKRIAAEFGEFVESNQRSFQLVLNEAEALAWQTDYPQLVFPTLALEKVQLVAAWQARQQSVQQSSLFFAEAA